MSTVGILTPPFVGVYGPRPYEAQPVQQKPQSPAMPQVTDEMVDEAMKALQRHAPFHISTAGMRAALEAALAPPARQLGINE